MTTAPAVTALDRTVVAPRAGQRIGWLDSLRVVLIAFVIVVHSVEPYAFRHAPELPQPDPPLPDVWVFLGIAAAFGMGLFFLLAGYFTPESFDRKRARAFLSGRVRRLGWPLLFGVVALVPFLNGFHNAFDPAMPRAGFWTYLVQDYFGFGTRPPDWPAYAWWPQVNFYHLWFIEHLLIYALLYAALRAVMRADTGAVARDPPSHLAIAAYALLLAAATFVIRIWYPENRWIMLFGFIQMEPAHWPQYVSVFAIGVFAGPRRWFETMPAGRGLTWFGIGAALAIWFCVGVGTGAIPGLQAQTVAGASADWQACLWEAFVCTGMCVGLPVLFRELALGTSRMWHILAANVLAVYVFHYPIVMALQWALIDAPAPKWLRMIVTVVSATVASFAFTNWVILRLPYARRVF